MVDKNENMKRALLEIDDTLAAMDQIVWILLDVHEEVSVSQMRSLRNGIVTLRDGLTKLIASMDSMVNDGSLLN